MAHPIPAAAIDDRLGFVGTSGSGKTYAAGTAVERLLAAGARVVIVDPLDVWWGLRLSADGKKPSRFGLPIFGGAHGDLPLNESAGKLIGETVTTMSESCIVSLKGLGTKEAERRFMLAFLDAAYRKANGSLTHWIFDEADLWAPQNTGKGAGPALQALMEQIVRRGRIDGFIPWLITQRPAVISKDVLSQVDGLVVMKLTASQDRDAIGAWVSGQADLDQWRDLKATLPTMEKGHGLVWLPGHGKLATAQFPAKATFDSSRAPKRGEKRTARDLKPLDLDALKGKLAAVEVEVNANDPAALKTRVRALEAELASERRRNETLAGGPSAEEVAALRRELAVARRQLEAAPGAGAPSEDEEAILRRGFDTGLQAARQAIAAIQYGYAVPPPDQRLVAPAPAKVARAKPSPVASDGIPAGCAKPLATIAAVYPSGMTDAQWAVAAGYKRSGGTWGTYKSRLTQAGLVRRDGDRWFMTEAGADVVGIVAVLPPPGPGLVRWWAAKLPGVSRIAEALIAAYPDPIARDELAHRVDMSPSGGSFGTYLSRLAGPGLIDRRDGNVVLTPEVME
jgi:hypothetical protein